MELIDQLRLRPGRHSIKKIKTLRAWQNILNSLESALRKNMVSYIDSELNKLYELLIKNKSLFKKDYYEIIKKIIKSTYELNWEIAGF